MVLTANSFVPKDQEAKLAIIQDLNDLMGFSLDPFDVAPPPTADEVRASLRDCARNCARPSPPPTSHSNWRGCWIRRRIPTMRSWRARPRSAVLAEAAPEALKTTLTAKRADRRNFAAGNPQRLDRGRWPGPRAGDPAGDSNDNAVLGRFVAAVRTMAPQASGPAVQIYEAGRAVSRAFRSRRCWRCQHGRAAGR